MVFARNAVCARTRLNSVQPRFPRRYLPSEAASNHEHLNGPSPISMPCSIGSQRKGTYGSTRCLAAKYTGLTTGTDKTWVRKFHPIAKLRVHATIAESVLAKWDAFPALRGRSAPDEHARISSRRAGVETCYRRRHGRLVSRRGLQRRPSGMGVLCRNRCS
jgi:hypothetical protein